MSALDHVFTYNDTSYTTLNTPYAHSTISSSNLVAGGKYIIFWAVKLFRDNAGSSQYCYLNWSTTGEITGSRRERECVESNDNQRFYGFSVVTAPSGEDLELLVNIRSSGGGTGEIYHSRMAAIRLDDFTEGTDYYHLVNDDLSSPVGLPNNSTFTDFLTMTESFTSGNWWFTTAIDGGMNNGSSRSRYYLEWSGGGLTSGITVDEQEQEAVTDHWPYHHSIVLNVNGTSATVNMKGNNSSGTAYNTHQYSEMFAINLDLFEDFAASFTEAEYTPSAATTFETLETVTFTPTTAGDWFFLGNAVYDAPGADFSQRITVDGTSVPSSDSETELSGTSDNNDRPSNMTIGWETLTASSTTVDLDTYVGGTGVRPERRQLVAIPMQIIGSGTTVSATTDTLSFTDNDATVTYSPALDVTGTADSLALTSNDTTVSYSPGVDVTSTTDSLFITENNTTVTQLITSENTTESLSLTSNDTTITTSLTVSATTDTLSTSENQVSLSVQTDISGTTDSLTLTSNDTTIDTVLTVSGTTDTLTISENDHNVTVGSTILTSTASLSLSENAASLNTVLEVTTTTDSLTVLENDATITIGGEVATTTDSLLVVPNDPTLDFALEVTSVTDSVALTENDVTVIQGLNVTATSDSLSATENDITADFVLTVESTTDSLTTTENDATVSTSAVITTTVDTLSTSTNDSAADFVLTVSGTTHDLTTTTNEAEAFLTNGQYILAMTSTSDPIPMIAVFARPGDNMYVFRHVQDDGTEEIINTGIVASGTDTLSIDVTTDNPVLSIDNVEVATSSLSYAATSVIFHGVGALIQGTVSSYMTGRIWDIYATDPNDSGLNRYYPVNEGTGSSLTDTLDGDVATVSGFDASMWS